MSILLTVVYFLLTLVLLRQRFLPGLLPGGINLLVAAILAFTVDLEPMTLSSVTISLV